MTDFLDPLATEAASAPGFDLTQFDDDFSEAPSEREYDKIPDGKYQVVVEHVELTRAQSSGNPLLKWKLRILAPQCAGRILWRNSNFAAKESLKFLKSDLHLCKLDLERLSDLPGRLNELVGVRLEITMRTNGKNENVYFNKLIDKPDPAAAAPGLDDPLPF